MADIYVATTGNDSTGTGAIGAPYRTVKKGLQSCSPGDTVHLRGGTYIEPAIFNHGLAGSMSLFEYGTQESERITLTGYTGESVTFRSSSPSFSGMRFQHTCRFFTIKDITLDAVNHVNGTDAHLFFLTQYGIDIDSVIIDNVTIDSPPAHGMFFDPWSVDCIVRNCRILSPGQSGYNNTNGIYIDGGTRVIVEDCYIEYVTATPTAGGGVRMYTNGTEIGQSGPGGGPVAPEGNNGIIRRNYVKNAGFSYVIGGNDMTCVNNISDGARNTHIQVVAPTQGTNDGMDIWHNTCYRATAGGGITGVLVSSTITGSGLDIRNNGFFEAPTTTINLNGVTPAANSNNLTSNPTFTDPDADDFHIADDGNWDEAGATIAAVTEDYDELSRPQATNYCVGAFEVPLPPEQNPVNVLPATYSGPINVSLSLTGISVTDADDDVTGAVTANTGVWLTVTGGTLAGTSTGTGTFQGEA